MGAVIRREHDSHAVDLTFLVRQVRWEAHDVVSVLLESADGNPLPPWTPGSHLDLHLPNGLTRNYSLCGTSDPRVWRIGVLREPQGGGGSAYIHDSLRVGAELHGHGPRNNFLLEPAASYLFIAGGIGITPVLPMVRQAEEQGVPWQLLYGGRTRASMAFLDELADFGDRVQAHPQDELGLLPLAEVLGEPVPDRLVYCCGPAALMDAVEAAMAAWPAESLVIERFRPVEHVESTSADAFEVVAAKSGVTVTVAPGESVLAALERSGVMIPNSCREGICGTCETRIVEGVADHRDSLLSDAERESMATMMVCVSRAAGSRLVLDA